MKTYAPKPRDIERRWYVVDASGAVLGRLATEVASILRGKHKPIFAPHMDTGDHVIVVNARGVRLTGGKEAKKMAYRHSGYPGGLTATSYERLLAQRPHVAVEKAIRGMLPKNRLGRAMIKKLQVYPGPEHPHQAQQPQPLKLGDVPGWVGLPQPGPKRAREPREPAERPAVPTAEASTAKRATAKSTAKSPAKATAKRTPARSAAKATAKTKAKSSTKATAKTTAKKTTAKKNTAKRTIARRKKED